MSDADCTPGREPRSVAASYCVLLLFCDDRYKNRPEMTFDDAGCEADQEFEMHSDTTGSLEYVTK